MTPSKIQMDQIRSTSATDTGENIRAGSQKKSSLSQASGLHGASPDATCTCPSGDGSLRHPCPAHPAVEQAGGDERDLQGAQRERDGWGPLPIVQVPWNVFDRAVMWVEDRRRYGDDGTIVDDWKALKTIQRAALAQPSPAQAEQAEAERPEVVGVRYEDGTILSAEDCGTALEVCAKVQTPLMTVAQHERIVGVLRFERQQMDRAFTACINERDAANARLHEVATACATAEQERDAALAEVERLRQFERICEGLPQDAIDGGWTVQGIRAHSKQLEEQLKVALARVAELTAARNRYGVDAHYFNMNLQRILRDFESFTPDELARSLIILAKVADEKVVAQAQHSVPEGWMLVECGIWTQEQVDEMQKTVARFRNSEFVDDRALAMAVADAGQCKAPEISLAELLAAAPGKEG